MQAGFCFPLTGFELTYLSDRADEFQAAILKLRVRGAPRKGTETNTDRGIFVFFFVTA